MAQQFSNAARSTLAQAMAASDINLLLAEGAGDLFPMADDAARTWWYLTLQEGERVEIVKVTFRDGDYLGVVRGQQGTLAQDWIAGTSCGLRVTAGDAVRWTRSAEVLGFDGAPSDGASDGGASDGPSGPLSLVELFGERKLHWLFMGQNNGDPNSYSDVKSLSKWVDTPASDDNAQRAAGFLSTPWGCEAVLRDEYALAALFLADKLMLIMGDASWFWSKVAFSPLAMNALVFGDSDGYADELEGIKSLVRWTDARALKYLLTSEMAAATMVRRPECVSYILANARARDRFCESEIAIAALAARPAALQQFLGVAQGVNALAESDAALRALAADATALRMVLNVPAFVAAVDDNGYLGELVAGAAAPGNDMGLTSSLLCDARFRAAAVADTPTLESLLDNGTTLAWLFGDVEVDGLPSMQDMESDRECDRNTAARGMWAEAVAASAQAAAVLCAHGAAARLLGGSWNWGGAFAQSPTALAAVCDSRTALEGILGGDNRSVWRNNAGAWDTLLASPLLTPVAVPVMTSDSVPSGRASASSVCDADHAAFKAFDGDPDTGWQPVAGQGAGAWLQYSFDQPCWIVSAQLMSDGYGGVDSAYIECSEDGSTWIQAGGIWGWAWNSPDNVVQVSSSGARRHWRLRVDRLQDEDWAGCVNHLELKGVR